MSLVYKELGELVDFKGGGTPSRNVEEYWGDSIPWATVKDLNEGITLTDTQEFINELGLKNSASNLIPKGSIIIPTRMALGKVVITEIDVAINQDLKAISIKKDSLDPKYLLWFLVSNKENIVSMGKGATVKGITLDQLKAINVPLPPLEGQRRIASILDKVDELRQKRQQAIEKLDQLLQATFIDMFGDPISNPKGWKVSSLGEQCKIGTGSTPSRLNSKNFEGTIPWVKSTEVDWGVITNTSETISQEGKESARLKTFPIGSIILALYGQGITRGKSALLGLEATLNQACAALVVKETIDNYFVFSFLKFSYKNLRSQARGGNQENLNLQIVKCFPIYLPPMELQEKWSKIALSIEDQKQKLYKQQTMQENLFKSLQNKAFSGTL